jgi:hypothetical protein
MKKAFLLASITIILIALAGCSLTVSARMYRMDDGMVTSVKFVRSFVGHKTGTAITPEGERLQWEFTTLSGASVRGGSATVATKYGWVTGMGFSFDQPGVQYGSFVAVGDKGTIIEAVYAVDPFSNHGHGVGKDNKDRRYRIYF